MKHLNCAIVAFIAVASAFSVASRPVAASVVAFDSLGGDQTRSATSSTDLDTIWGDRVVLTRGGLLDEFAFQIFNSSSSGTTYC